MGGVLFLFELLYFLLLEIGIVGGFGSGFDVGDVGGEGNGLFVLGICGKFFGFDGLQWYLLLRFGFFMMYVFLQLLFFRSGGGVCISFGFLVLFFLFLILKFFIGLFICIVVELIELLLGGLQLFLFFIDICFVRVVFVDSCLVMFLVWLGIEFF